MSLPKHIKYDYYNRIRTCIYYEFASPQKLEALENLARYEYFIVPNGWLPYRVIGEDEISNAGYCTQQDYIALKKRKAYPVVAHTNRHHDLADINVYRGNKLVYVIDGRTIRYATTELPQ